MQLSNISLDSWLNIISSFFGIIALGIDYYLLKTIYNLLSDPKTEILWVKNKLSVILNDLKPLEEYS